jgi:hypothetical protein
MQDSLTEQWTDRGLLASVQLRCAFSDRHLLAADIVGNMRQWPRVVGSVSPRAASASIRPLGGKATTDGQALVYDDAIVTVNYENRDVEDRPVGGGGSGSGSGSSGPTQLVSESIEPMLNKIKLDHKMFRWGNVRDQPLQENEAPSRSEWSMSIRRTHYRVPPPLPSALIDLIGCVNDSDYYSELLGMTFPAETLLFQPGPLTRTIMTDGSGRAYDVNMMFHYKPDGWNKFWCALTAQYEEMFYIDTTNNGSDPYKNNEPADFSMLLY